MFSSASRAGPTTRSKGKARATSLSESDPTERDPLLPSNINAQIAADRRPFSSPRSRKAGSILLTISIALLSLLIGLVLFIALLGNSFRPSEAEIAVLTKTAFRYNPSPVSVAVLNVTDDGVLVNATILCGLDVDRALGVQRFDSEEDKEAAGRRGERGTGAAWWENLRRWAASRGLGRLSDRRVIVTLPSAVNIFARQSDSTPLFAVHIQAPLDVPMISGVQDQRGDWMKPMSVLALAKPLASTADLMEFGQRGWAAGSMGVVVNVKKAVVDLPGLTGWMAKYGKVEKKGIVMDVQVPIPHFPGLPEPGHPIDFAKLVALEAYHLSNNGDALEIRAGASMPNLAKSTRLNVTIPYGLPFSLVLPAPDGSGEKLLAQVVTEPVILDHGAKDIKLRMAGRIISESDEGDSPLGPFIHNYLTGIDNAITVRGMSTYPTFASNTTTKPPSWALSSLQSIEIKLVIPGPQPPPKIINAMNMEHMRISRSGGVTKCSGTVIVEIDLPGDIGSIEVDVEKVLPEVYMFDGPVQDGNGEDEYPPGAFGHVKPAEYLNSTTVKGLDPAFPNRLTVRAPMVDVPVEILPGRSRLLADFARKVVFKGGAMAGVNGSASAVMRMKGIGGVVVVDGLPIRGETWVGRQRVQAKRRLLEEEKA